MKTGKYVIIGFCFVFILMKSEAVSWFRIVEMFHFQSFHMFGLIGSAIVTGALTVFLLRRLDHALDVTPKPYQPKRNLIGGVVFGMGWSIAGACTAPLFIHLGTGNLWMVIPLVSAILGTFAYAKLKNKLPH